MNNQEAINLLRNLEKSLDGYCGINDEGKCMFNMAVQALEQEKSGNQINEDAISRKDTVTTIIKKLGIKDISYLMPSEKVIVDVIEAMPYIETNIKPVGYQDCANAMMRMWMDDVVTDGEYSRIMDKLNAHEIARRGEHGSGN